MPTDSHRMVWLQVAAASRDVAWLLWGMQWMAYATMLFATCISESVAPWEISGLSSRSLSQALIPGRADTFLKYQSVLLARVNNAGNEGSS